MIAWKSIDESIKHDTQPNMRQIISIKTKTLTKLEKRSYKAPLMTMSFITKLVAIIAIIILMIVIVLQVNKRTSASPVPKDLIEPDDDKAQKRVSGPPAIVQIISPNIVKKRNEFKAAGLKLENSKIISYGIFPEELKRLRDIQIKDAIKLEHVWIAKPNDALEIMKYVFADSRLILDQLKREASYMAIVRIESTEADVQILVDMLSECGFILKKQRGELKFKAKETKKGKQPIHLNIEFTK